MRDLLKDKVAVITGAAQGNGEGIAIGLARQGARVALLDINLATAEEVASRLRCEGRHACAFACDVTDAACCRDIATQIGEALGSVSILVNNAGVLLRGKIDDDDAELKLQMTMKVNLFGMTHMVTACLRDLRRTRGSVINLASIQSFVALSNSAAYNASKGAVLQLTKALASELAPDGIRVNAIAPGFIATPLNAEARAKPGYVEDFLKRVPLGRLGVPEDLVGPAIFLASDMSSYITGTILPVDGGFLAV